MKTKNLLIIFTLFFISFDAFASDFKEIFGLKLYENADRFINENFFSSNKLKNKETYEGYYDIDITNAVTNKNPFLSKYWIVIDEINIIKQISAEEKILNFKKCIDFKEELLSIFKDKYKLLFYNKIFTHKKFISNQNFVELKNGNYLFIKCVNNFINDDINLIISFEAKDFYNRKKEFYESGF